MDPNEALAQLLAGARDFREVNEDDSSIEADDARRWAGEAMATYTEALHGMARERGLSPRCMGKGAHHA